MEEQGGARPCITFFPPPQSRQLTGPRTADPDLDTDSHSSKSHLAKSSSRTSRHELLLLEKKVKHFEDAKKKTERFHKRLQQQFLKEEERKVMLRKKASERFEKSLEVLSRRSGKPALPATHRFSAREATPLEDAGAAAQGGTRRHV